MRITQLLLLILLLCDAHGHRTFYDFIERLEISVEYIFISTLFWKTFSVNGILKIEYFISQKIVMELFFVHTFHYISVTNAFGKLINSLKIFCF